MNSTKLASLTSTLEDPASRHPCQYGRNLEATSLLQELQSKQREDKERKAEG